MGPRCYTLDSVPAFRNFELMRDAATGELLDCGFMRDLPNVVGRENTDPEVRERYCGKMKREGWGDDCRVCDVYTVTGCCKDGKGVPVEECSTSCADLERKNGMRTSTCIEDGILRRGDSFPGVVVGDYPTPPVECAKDVKCELCWFEGEGGDDNCGECGDARSHGDRERCHLPP